MGSSDAPRELLDDYNKRVERGGGCKYKGEAPRKVVPKDASINLDTKSTSKPPDPLGKPFHVGPSSNRVDAKLCFASKVPGGEKECLDDKPAAKPRAKPKDPPMPPRSPRGAAVIAQAGPAGGTPAPAPAPAAAVAANNVDFQPRFWIPSGGELEVRDAAKGGARVASGGGYEGQDGANPESSKGLFATRALAPGLFLPYLGRRISVAVAEVMPEGLESRYLINVDDPVHHPGMPVTEVIDAFYGLEECSSNPAACWAGRVNEPGPGESVNVKAVVLDAEQQNGVFFAGLRQGAPDYGAPYERGKPNVFLVTVAPIGADEELLMSYDEVYGGSQGSPPTPAALKGEAQVHTLLGGTFYPAKTAVDVLDGASEFYVNDREMVAGEYSLQKTDLYNCRALLEGRVVPSLGWRKENEPGQPNALERARLVQTAQSWDFAKHIRATGKTYYPRRQEYARAAEGRNEGPLLTNPKANDKDNYSCPKENPDWLSVSPQYALKSVRVPADTALPPLIRDVGSKFELWYPSQETEELARLGFVGSTVDGTPIPDDKSLKLVKKDKERTPRAAFNGYTVSEAKAVKCAKYDKASGKWDNSNEWCSLLACLINNKNERVAFAVINFWWTGGDSYVAEVALVCGRQGAGKALMQRLTARDGLLSASRVTRIELHSVDTFYAKDASADACAPENEGTPDFWSLNKWYRDLGFVNATDCSGTLTYEHGAVNSPNTMVLCRKSPAPPHEALDADAAAQSADGAAVAAAVASAELERAASEEELTQAQERSVEQEAEEAGAAAALAQAGEERARALSAETRAKAQADAAPASPPAPPAPAAPPVEKPSITQTSEQVALRLRRLEKRTARAHKKSLVAKRKHARLSAKATRAQPSSEGESSGSSSESSSESSGESSGESSSGSSSDSDSD